MIPLKTRPVDPEAAAARFIALERHESTHDRLVWNMRMNRDKAAAGVPDWQELRELASQITHLDQYLEQFEENATKLGTKVTGRGMPPSTTRPCTTSCSRMGSSR